MVSVFLLPIYFSANFSLGLCIFLLWGSPCHWTLLTGIRKIFLPYLIINWFRVPKRLRSLEILILLWLIKWYKKFAIDLVWRFRRTIFFWKFKNIIVHPWNLFIFYNVPLHMSSWWYFLQIKLNSVFCSVLFISDICFCCTSGAFMMAFLS